MYWIKSGIENPSKPEVIDRCGGDGKTECPRITDTSRTLKTKTTNKGANSYNFKFKKGKYQQAITACYGSNVVY